MTSMKKSAKNLKMVFVLPSVKAARLAELKQKFTPSTRKERKPMTQIPAFNKHDRVKFTTPKEEARYWWDVRTGDDRYTILTKQEPFQPKGDLWYTIIDRETGMRGPCNLIGGGWDSKMSDAKCEALLRALQRANNPSLPPAEYEDSAHSVEVSHRNRIPVEISEVASHKHGREQQ